MTQKIPPPIAEDACKKTVYLLRAMGPCRWCDIADELQRQCAGVTQDNIGAVTDLSIATLHVKHVIELDTDNLSWDINPFMYGGDGSTWVGPKEYDFS